MVAGTERAGAGGGKDWLVISLSCVVSGLLAWAHLGFLLPWRLQVQVPSEQPGSCITFSELASYIMQRPFSHVLWVISLWPLQGPGEPDSTLGGGWQQGSRTRRWKDRVWPCFATVALSKSLAF